MVDYYYLIFVRKKIIFLMVAVAVVMVAMTVVVAMIIVYCREYIILLCGIGDGRVGGGDDGIGDGRVGGGGVSVVVVAAVTVAGGCDCYLL